MKGRMLVTRHARDQARDRWPGEFKGMPVERMCGRLCGEVSAAIAAGRMAVHRPRWSVRKGSSVRASAVRKGIQGGRNPGHRFVWNEARTRLYIVHRTDQRCTIVTVMPVEPAVEVAA